MHAKRHALIRTLLIIVAAGIVVAPRPAAAQYGTLNLFNGDKVAVTGTATVGTIGGEPVADTTSSYDDDGGNNFYAVDAETGSMFTLAGGTVTGEGGDDAIYADGATIDITSGSVNTSGSGTDGIDASHSSTVTISGGTFLASGTGANVAHPATGALLTPGPPLGSVDLYSESGSMVSVTGGLFRSTGSGTVGLFAQSGGVITLYGTGFTVNGSPATGPLTNGAGTIGGTLLDGDTLSALPYSIIGGTIEFAPLTSPAPEPSSWATLSLAALGLGSLLLRARRRPAA